METERILVVDDDEKICQILTLYLRSRGYEVTSCRNGSNALTAFSDSAADLIILDITLPGMDGLSILRKLRETSNVPVIMLTAHTDEDERVRALGLGADDFIIKPFDPKELVARIRAVLRRSGSGPAKSVKLDLLSVGDLTIDRTSRRVRRSGIEIKLADREYELLLLLVLYKNRVVKRSRILEDVFPDLSGLSRSPDVHISRLKSRLGPSDDWAIETIPRVGYRFSVRKQDRG